MTFGTRVHRPATLRPVRPGFDRLMADLVRDFGVGVPRVRYVAKRAAAPAFEPCISAEELEDEYRVVAEVPGVEAKDLSIQIQDGVLTLKGERFFGAPLEVRDEDVAEDRGETGEDAPVARASVNFERKLRFSAKVVEGDVKASLKNGVLTVTIPKQAPAAPEVRSIPVETV